MKASITGSIIGNILLVMGVSILGGGMRFPEQRFNKTAARASATTLTLAAVALTIPTVFHVTAAGRPASGARRRNKSCPSPSRWFFS